MARAAGRRQVLEVAEKLGQSSGEKGASAPPRLAPLLSEVKITRDRVVGIVNLRHEVGDRELELMQPEPAALVPGSEPVARTEVLQDVRRLSDQRASRLEEGRCEWRRIAERPVAQQREHRRYPGLPS